MYGIVVTVFVDRYIIPMKYASAGRAIIIALLFIAMPVFPTNKKPADTSVMGRMEPSRSISAGVFKTPATQTSEKGTAVADSELEANQNKDKLTIFFAIGLVINIFLMSLFGVWAVRQWRKSDKRGQAIP